MFISEKWKLIPKVPSFLTTFKYFSNFEKIQSSAFEIVKSVVPAEVFLVTEQFNKDENELKVNLGVGAYRTDDNKPYIMPIVKHCELEVVKDANLNHEYLPMSGYFDFIKAATDMLLGIDCTALKEERVVAVQTISGTGACKLAADFLVRKLNRDTIYIPNPTWENHANIFKKAGFRQIKTYPYWNPQKKMIDMPGLLDQLCAAREGSVVLLHAAAHNPTGMDPTREEWKQIAAVVRNSKLFPFFDSAYQGFATGDLDEDAWAVRYFVEQNFELMIAQSFSKNMGLYNERVGNLIAVMNNKEFVHQTYSQLNFIIRRKYSTPPAFGCRVVARVLNNRAYRDEWLKTLQEMTNRVKKMRLELCEKLVKLETPGKWDTIIRQHGMFAYTGLNEMQVEKLKMDYHIYMLKSGRINVCGLNSHNIDYVSESISEVVKSTQNQNGEC